MPTTMRHVGLDVHAEAIAIAVAEPDGQVRELGTIRNRPEAVRKLIAKLGGPAGLRVCYEAGPTGYTLYWQLAALGVACDVIAPSLIPTKAGDRVKTDRKEAVRLARCHRAGDLTAVWVPDAATEALRDLVRAREVTNRATHHACGLDTAALWHWSLRGEGRVLTVTRVQRGSLGLRTSPSPLRAS